MKREVIERAAIDLGSASDKTLGGEGKPFDLVREIPATNGIVDD